jgi:ribA/ribD-fused uncharacterized protein
MIATRTRPSDRTFPFSNFQPFEIHHRGITYMNVETFYEAMKSMDPEIQQQISTMQPGKAKRFTRTIEVRDDWEDIKEQVMMHALRKKFAPGGYWAKRLLSTGDNLLVEDNWWHDNFWGSCLCDRCGDQGQNKLGHMIRQLKDEMLMAGSENQWRSLRPSSWR